MAESRYDHGTAGILGGITIQETPGPALSNMVCRACGQAWGGRWSYCLHEVSDAGRPGQLRTCACTEQVPGAPSPNLTVSRDGKGDLDPRPKAPELRQAPETIELELEAAESEAIVTTEAQLAAIARLHAAYEAWCAATGARDTVAELVWSPRREDEPLDIRVLEYDAAPRIRARVRNADILRDAHALLGDWSRSVATVLRASEAFLEQLKRVPAEESQPSMLTRARAFIAGVVS